MRTRGTRAQQGEGSESDTYGGPLIDGHIFGVCVPESYCFLRRFWGKKKESKSHFVGMGGAVAMERKWSHKVMETSNALDLEQGVFTWDDPERIARSLMRSAETSVRRKTEPYQSAMSMLSFYINRAGKNLPSERRTTLSRAKEELKKLKPQDLKS